MTPEKYNRVKEIFLAACDKPAEEQEPYIQKAVAGDDEIRLEVESLLHEHRRDFQVMPSDPESPLGPMSSILSRANLDGPADAPPVVPNNVNPPNIPHEPTRYLDDSASTPTGSASGIVDAGRFMAGTIVGGRYRIIELLGRGGMGEVYRADDLTLNQSVALKFLPAIFSADQKWLERFRNEVRLSRQVTHPNVCRVFDIDEFQGEQFISMEYVDGENLGSLLRRIDRLPSVKGIQIARQLCAGLAAAHDRGVLHRDLKPANVMIDGRGAVRITDFGLAAPVDDLRREAVRAGTPAYMSPEQLAGKQVSVRSDIYSLGLILYEMFTGRRAFKAESLRDYQRLHSSQNPTPPSDIIEDIDPIVDRVIMKCVAKDPKDRPASAMAVAAALPGGNPLREILAAGETPSPEVVAAAGEAHGILKPITAIYLLAVALASLIAFVYFAPHVFVVQNAIRESSSDPAFLNVQAVNILHDLGYDDKPADSAYGFGLDYTYFLHLEHDKTTIDRRHLLWQPRPGLIYFWYRQSPETLIPLHADGSIQERDPSPLLPGMKTVRLDPKGRLIDLEVRADPSPASAPAATAPPATALTGGTAALASARADSLQPLWTQLFSEAKIDPSRFHSVAPEDPLPVYADENQRAAWEGTLEDAPNEPVRIEAAAYQGKVVYFAVQGKWKEVDLSEARAMQLSVGQSNAIIQATVGIILLICGTWLGWRNYRSGRGDRAGAARMAFAFFCLGFIAWLFQAHHISDIGQEFLLFQRGMGPVLYLVSLIWMFYMALEPYVRRIWPETVISWSRLITGRWIDPLVGRDVLAGATLGVTIMIITLCEQELPRWLHIRAPLPSISSTARMLNSVSTHANIFNGAIISLYEGLFLLLFLVLVRMLTRRRWIAGVAFVLLFASATAYYNATLPFEGILSWIVQSIIGVLFLGLIMRHGLVAIIFCLLVRGLLADFPVTWNLSVWYAPSSMAAIAAVTIILAVSFYAALGGRLLSSIRIPKG